MKKILFCMTIIITHGLIVENAQADEASCQSLRYQTAKDFSSAYQLVELVAPVRAVLEKAAANGFDASGYNQALSEYKRLRFEAYKIREELKAKATQLTAEELVAKSTKILESEQLAKDLNAQLMSAIGILKEAAKNAKVKWLKNGEVPSETEGPGLLVNLPAGKVAKFERQVGFSSCRIGTVVMDKAYVYFDANNGKYLAQFVSSKEIAGVGYSFCDHMSLTQLVASSIDGSPVCSGVDVWNLKDILSIE